MRLHELLPSPGSRFPRKRKGRGIASGQGKTAGRGQKGHKARSGYKVRRGFEGGQMPLFQRLPKRGFRNIFAKKPAVINIQQLNVFEEGAIVTPELLIERGLVKSAPHGIKVLGRGNLDKNLVVHAQSFSRQAREKIENAGGRAEVIDLVRNGKKRLEN